MSKDTLNGTAVKPADTKKVEPKSTATATNTPTNQPPVITAQLPTQEEKIPSFSDRLHKLNQLFALQSKHEKLTESKEKLKNFIIAGNDGAALELEDSDGNTFTTRNNEIIEDVVNFLKEKIASKCIALEQQITW